jgi:hypothetical protein
LCRAQHLAWRLSFAPVAALGKSLVEGRVAGLDPQCRACFSRATFADPDGNTWVLHVVVSRA